MLALVDRLELAPAGRPIAAQRHAVADAEQRARQRWTLPAYTIGWVTAPEASIVGLTRYEVPPPVRVFLLDALEPPACYSTTFHEMQHVADYENRWRMSVDELEQRADAIEHTLRGDPMYQHWIALSRRVDALVAQGYSRTEAWARVDSNKSRRPFDDDDDAESTIATGRNGHTRGAAAPAPVKICLSCGGAVFGTASSGRCFGCGMMYFGGQ
jgi:hypothetical protein